LSPLTLGAIAWGERRIIGAACGAIAWLESPWIWAGLVRTTAMPYLTFIQTIVETPPYLADAERLDPQCSVVIPRTGAIRKLRVAASGRGKARRRTRGYLFAGDDLPVFLLAVFAKNERSDLSPAERSSLRKLTMKMLRTYRSGP
jgi:hypothetical protein